MVLLLDIWFAACQKKINGIVLDTKKKNRLEVLKLPIPMETGTSRHPLKTSVPQSYVPYTRLCICFLDYVVFNNTDKNCVNYYQI